MKNLKLSITVRLDEVYEPARTNTNLAILSTSRIITGELREALDHENTMSVILRELKSGNEHIEKNILEQIKLPFVKDIEQYQKEIERGLAELFPDLRIHTYFNGKFRLHHISSKKDFELSEGIDIFHPKDGSYLTTEYRWSFNKLDDGTWTYTYQYGRYFEGVVKIIPAPLDEKVLDNFFKQLNIEYEIPTKTLQPIPEPEPKEEEEEDNVTF